MPTPAGTFSIGDALRAPAPCFSFEFFPPKDDEGERVLWRSVRELERLRPTFVSMTYGAGGSTRGRTTRITGEIATETTLDVVAHLTTVGHTVDELREVVGQYAAAGVRHVLALRGDPADGPGAPWTPTPGGLDHADDLVRLVRSLGSFEVGVAAYARGHREAPTLDADARVVVAKAEAGARFAVTDFFFEASDYAALVERVRGLGCDLPIVPGIMPLTTLRQITRMAELSGHEVPDRVVRRLEPHADDPSAVRAEGTEIARELCEALLADGAPGLHFYTLNRSRATLDIYRGLAPVPTS